MLTKEPQFEKKLWHIDHLSYKDEILVNSVENFRKITNGLLEAIGKKDLYHALSFFLTQLQRYIQLYEIQMTKEDHILILRILYSLMMEKNLHADIFKGVTYLISMILPRSSQLTRNDIDFINWKELFDFYNYVAKGKDKEGRFSSSSHSLEQLQITIMKLRYLFPLSATKEIVNELRTYFYPFDSTMEYAIKMMTVFVPRRMTFEEHSIYGAKLWFDEVWKWYNLSDHNHVWDGLCVQMFSSLAKNCCGFVNWEDKYDIIMSKSLRNLDITFGNNREISLTDDNSNTSLRQLATWFIYMLGGKNDGFQNYLSQLFISLESYFHPSNYGDHVESLAIFVGDLTTEMCTRIHYERYSAKPINTLKEMLLTDIQIEKFVRTIMQAMKWLVFSKCETDIIPNTIKMLCDISPGIVLPFILKIIYPALRNVSAPHRLRQSMQCFIAVCINLIRDFDCTIKRDPCDENVLREIEIMYLEKENLQDIEKLNKKGLDKNTTKALKKKIKFRKGIIDKLSNDSSTNVKNGNSLENGRNLLKIELEADVDLKDISLVQRKSENSTTISTNPSLFSQVLQHDFSGPLRFHVILLLEVIIKSFDINDIEKTTLSLEALTRIFNLIIVADCSGAVDQIKSSLNSEEIRLCELTKEFPRIIKLFISNVLRMIEMLEAGGARIRNDDADCGKVSGLSEYEENDKEALLSTEEVLLRENLVFVFSGLLENCSSSIRKVIFDSVLKFVKDNVFENQLSISIVTGVISQIIYYDPDYAFPLLYKHVTKNLPAHYPLTKKDTEIDIALMWYISLACCILSMPSSHILKYKKEVSELAQFIIGFDHKMIYHLACTGLTNTFTNLVGTYTEVNTKLIAKVDKPLTEFLPIRHWAEMCNKRNPNKKIDFHTPSKEEIDFAFDLANLILIPYVEELSNIENLSKKQLRKALGIIKTVLSGMSEILKPLDGKKIPLYKLFDCDNPDLYFNNITKKREIEEYIKGKPNLRNIVFESLTKIFPYMLTKREAEITNINMILSIYNKILFTHGITSTYYNDEQSDAQHNENIYRNSVLGAKADIFDVVRKKVSLCHSTRLMLVPTEPCLFNDTYIKVLNDYVRAVESNCKKISNAAISYIEDFLNAFPKALKYLLPNIKECLSLKDEKNEYRICAGYKLIAIDMCYSTRDFSIKNNIIKCISESSKHFEHQIVVKCIKDDCIPALAKWRRTPIDLKISKSLHQFSIGEYLKRNKKELQIQDCDKLEKLRNDESLNEYKELIETIILTLSNIEIHWQIKKMFLDLLSNFITRHLQKHHFDCIVRYLLDSDPENVKVAVYIIVDYLILTKPSIIKMEVIPPKSKFNRNFNDDGVPLYGLLEDNLCMTYESYTDQKSLKQVSKNYVGFVKWPKKITVSATCDNQIACNRSFEELTECEKSIVSFLKQYENIEKFFSLLALTYSEKSGFYSKVASFISQLGRNFNDILLPNFIKILESHVVHEKVPERKIAAVVFAGLARGIKYWNMTKYEKFINIMNEKLPKIWESMTPEIFSDWAEAISLVLAKRDVRRYKWLVDLVFNFANQIHPNMHPILIQMRLTLLGMINCSFAWRGTSIMTKAVEIAIQHLFSPHHSVTKGAADIISDACLMDIQGLGFDERIPPSMKPFDMDIIFEKLGENLNVMMSEGYTKCFFTGSDLIPMDKQSKIYKSSFNVLQSMISILENRFITGYLRFTSYIFVLIPIIANFENDVNDNMRKTCALALNEIFPKLILKKPMMSEFIQTMEHGLKYARSWKTQCSLLRVTRTIIFGNYFNAIDKEYQERIEKIIVQMIMSPSIEVRNTAADSLTGLILCDYLPVHSNLLNTFVKAAVNKDENECRKHGGVLGLGAIILGFPYTCPIFIPKIIVALAKIARKSESKILHNSMINTLREFKRTHQDTWDEHEKCFKKDQLAILNNILTSPNYYV
uniref:Proteasome activator complex subunit 4 n=1 Tax=Parastrongyloides trichosuri TaxID=131310 RepID=A0A0N4ZRB1_PARTI